MQETWVRSLVQEDPTRLRATKPVCTTAEPACCHYWNPHTLEPVLCNRRSHSNETPRTSNQRVAPALHKDREKPTNQQRPNIAKVNKYIKLFFKKRVGVFLCWEWCLSLHCDGRFWPLGSTNKHQEILMFKKGSIFKKDNLSIHARRCLWF